LRSSRARTQTFHSRELHLQQRPPATATPHLRCLDDGEVVHARKPRTHLPTQASRAELESSAICVRKAGRELRRSFGRSKGSASLLARLRVHVPLNEPASARQHSVPGCHHCCWWGALRRRVISALCPAPNSRSACPTRPRQDARPARPRSKVLLATAYKPTISRAAFGVCPSLETVLASRRRCLNPPSRARSISRSRERRILHGCAAKRKFFS
jgi:hypothetical protein